MKKIISHLPLNYVIEKSCHYLPIIEFIENQEFNYRTPSQSYSQIKYYESKVFIKVQNIVCQTKTQNFRLH